MIMNEIKELDMDMILNMTPEEFTKMMKAQSLGFNTSLSNLLKLQFSQCSNIKDSLVALIRTDKVPKEDKEKHETALKDLYTALQLIEDRHTIVETIIKSKMSR